MNDKNSKIRNGDGVNSITIETQKFHIRESKLWVVRRMTHGRKTTQHSPKTFWRKIQKLDYNKKVHVLFGFVVFFTPTKQSIRNWQFSEKNRKIRITDGVNSITIESQKFHTQKSKLWVVRRMTHSRKTTQYNPKTFCLQKIQKGARIVFDLFVTKNSQTTTTMNRREMRYFWDRVDVRNIYVV